MSKITFGERETVGRVVYVDTNQVIIEVEDSEKTALLNIGGVVAIQVMNLLLV